MTICYWGRIRTYVGVLLTRLTVWTVRPLRQLSNLLLARWDLNPRLQHRYEYPHYQCGSVHAIIFAGWVGNDPTILGLTNRRCTILASSPYFLLCLWWDSNPYCVDFKPTDSAHIGLHRHKKTQIRFWIWVWNLYSLNILFLDITVKWYQPRLRSNT